MTTATKSESASGDGRKAAGENIEHELGVLKDDITKLSQQVAHLVSATGSVAMRRAKKNIDGLMSQASEKGQEAAGAVREVTDTLAEAIEDSIEKRPYTTLAMTLGLGFLLGAAWRR